jgi:tripartite-type tricarboxylate transporter receptor subunit TctC
MTAKIDIVHVPYKGGGPAVADLVGGKVDLLFTGAPVTMAHIKAGRLKLLAVTDSRRSAALPDTPTMAESLPGFEFNNWYGIMAPAGTPRAIVELLNAEVHRALALPEIREKFSGLGADPTPSTPERFAAVMAADAEKWGRVIRQAGVRAD